MYTQYIYNHHLDGYGHVNHARYLEFLEAARWHFFIQRNLKSALCQAQFVVTHLEVTYRQAVQLGETIYIHTYLNSVQSRQLIVQQEIRLENGSVCLQATVTLMPTDAQRKITRLPENLKNIFLQLLHPSTS